MAVSTKVGVLDKVVEVLHAFPRGGDELTPQQIAKQLGWPLPTVYRLTQAMTQHGLLDRQGSRLRLGLELMHLGAKVSRGIDLRPVVLPQLRWLNDQTRENAQLVVRRAEMRVLVELVVSPQNLRPFAEVGEPLPLHVGASAHVLLAWLDEDAALALASRSAARFTPTVEVDPDRLAAKLAEVRRAGFAFSNGERASGVASIAAPVRDREGAVIAAVSLTTPAVRMNTRRRRALVPLVMMAAEKTSADLGWRIPLPSSAAADAARAGT